MYKSKSKKTPPESIKRGRWERWGSRVFLQDAHGGLFTLREQMVKEIGPEFTSDIFYRAGFASAEKIMVFVHGQAEAEKGLSRLDFALDLLTQGGYGNISVEQEQALPGEITIHVENSLEGEIFQDSPGRTGYLCDYMRGLFQGIVQALPKTEGYPEGQVDCVEIRCQANGDSHCRFIVAAPAHLARHGYRVGDRGHSSVRETLLRLNRQLEDVLEAAKRDTLTGLYNRAHFETALRHRIEFASRRTDTLAVAMIDMDGFKEVNDTQGHGMGDLALRQVGHLLAGQARDTDLVARYGGDEFAWLMPATSMETALMVADRIRQRVMETREEMDLPISLSIGIAACPEDADSMTDLIDRADAAMYLAKSAGGNQVRRYVATEDHRSATQKRVRKPRPRGGHAPPLKPLPEEGILQFDLTE
jgi:diguanylate cyclase (GGDEF)-like protein